MRDNKGKFVIGSEPYNKKNGKYNKCLKCGKEFYVTPSQEKSGSGKYCSRLCQHPPVTKDCAICTIPFKIKPSHFNKRTTCSRSCYSELKKLQLGYWLGKERPGMKSEKNHNWKGDNAGYSAFHGRVKRQRGNANDYPCSMKDATCKGQHDWASISHNANADINDYMPLCHSHHARYDGWKPKR